MSDSAFHAPHFHPVLGGLRALALGRPNKQASWSIYLGDTNARRVPPGNPLAESDQYATLQHGLGEVIAMLYKTGAKRILLVAPSPAFNLSTPECLFRARRLGLSLDTCSRPEEPIGAQRQETLAALTTPGRLHARCSGY